jgi:hypothetical protein
LRTTLRQLVAAIASLACLAVLGALLFVVKGLLRGNTVSDAIEWPVEITLGVVLFLALFFRFRRLERAPAMWGVALVALMVLAVLVGGAWAAVHGKRLL